MALWLYDYMAANPIESFCLMQWGKTTKAKLLDVHEDFQEQEAGPGYEYGVALFQYTTSKGQSVTSETRQLRGGLPEGWLDEQTRPSHIEVEYFPRFHSWNRLAGTGIQTFPEWLWRQALLGTMLLAMLVAPGVTLLRTGIREIRSALQAEGGVSFRIFGAEQVHEDQAWLAGWILGLAAVFTLYGIADRSIVPLVASLALLAVLTLLYFWLAARSR